MGDREEMREAYYQYATSFLSFRLHYKDLLIQSRSVTTWM